MGKYKRGEGIKAPEKLSYYSTEDTEASAKGIDAILRSNLQIAMRMHKKRKQEWSFEGQYGKRREEAVRRSIEAVIGRHDMTERTRGHVPTAWLWCRLNLLPSMTLEECEDHISVFLGAAVWIMDRVAVPGSRQWRKILETIEYEEDWELPPFYDMRHSDEALRMVAFILRHRHKAEHEWLDASPAPGDTSQALQKLLDLIDPAQLRHAVATIRGLFARHEDAFFQLEYALVDDFNAAVDSYNAAVDKFNAEIDAMEATARECVQWREGLKKKPLHPTAGSPMRSAPIPSPEDFTGMMASTSAKFLLEPMKLDSMNPFERMDDHLDRLRSLSRDAFEKEEGIHKAQRSMSMRTYDFTFCGLVETSEFVEHNPDIKDCMPRVSIPDPYEACMGLLLLCTPSALKKLYADIPHADLQRDLDLPWLMGAMCATVTSIADTLPWSVDCLDEFDLAEKKATKSLRHPDWYAMDFEDEEGTRLNLAQILYRETGSILSRDMGAFDYAHETLRSLGIRGQKEIHLTELMTLMKDVQFHFDPLTHAPAVTEPEPSEDVEALKAEVKTLREKLKTVTDEAHAQDRRARKAEQALSQEREKIEMDRQELASLRELVFIRENGDAADESVSVKLPYTVQHHPVVYGGHDTWLRAMREYLSGDIRFMDKDQAVIDRSVIRHADVVWIQTNAIAHKQYYAVINEVRKIGVPVRYFLYASARKCAEQVVLYEQEG